MSELSIVLEGLPEKVQRVADVIEDAFPGVMVWVQSDDHTGDITIKIEGYELPRMPISAMTTDCGMISPATNWTPPDGSSTKLPLVGKATLQ